MICTVKKWHCSPTPHTPTCYHPIYLLFIYLLFGVIKKKFHLIKIKILFNFSLFPIHPPMLTDILSANILSLSLLFKLVPKNGKITLLLTQWLSKNNQTKIFVLDNAIAGAASVLNCLTWIRSFTQSWCWT